MPTQIMLSKIAFASMRWALVGVVLFSVGWPADGLAALSPQTGQAFGQKLVDYAPNKRDEAVWVYKMTIDGQEIQPGVPFQAGNDWVSKMTIFLWNRTSKTVVFSDIVLGFPETGDGRTPETPQAMFNIDIGKLPAVAAFTGTGKPIPPPPGAEPLSFGPGRTLRIRVADYLAEINAYPDHIIALEQITHCVIFRGTFYFDDGMKWQPSGFSVPDPDHPGKYKYVEGRYFPGRPTPEHPPSTP